jgi:hypothetical protein
MEVLRNLFGNLTAGIIRLLVTVGILVAVYFFVVRPTLDTTEKIGHEVNGNIQRGFKEADIQASARRSTTSTAGSSAKSRSRSAGRRIPARPTG